MFFLITLSRNVRIYKYMNSKKIKNIPLSQQIRQAREKLKLTQEEVAEKAKMSVTYFAMIERGEVNPSYKKIQSLAKVLKLKITIT